jgi:hypothetical protein
MRVLVFLELRAEGRVVLTSVEARITTLVTQPEKLEYIVDCNNLVCKFGAVASRHLALEVGDPDSVLGLTLPCLIGGQASVSA